MMNWQLFFPELFTVGTAGLFLVLSLKPTDAGRQFKLALALAVAGFVICAATLGQTGTLFNGTYRVDLFSQVFKTMIYAGFLFIIGLCHRLKGVPENRHSEFYLVLSICTLALMILVGCIHFLPFFLALETSSYCLYILVFIRKGYKTGLESGLKYFFMGATASALMIFGFALLYYAGHTLYFADLGRALAGQLHHPVVQAGFILGLSGVFFKLAVAPFHFWAPDVYEGAPHQVAAYIATVSKVAAIAAVIRLVSLCGTGGGHLVFFLLVVSAAVMTIGNFAAIVQEDLKRLLAYSSIAHAGYLMIGVASMNMMGWTSTIFYALSLLIMKLTAFMAVIFVSRNGENIRISQLAGLHEQAPALALALMLALFGLAGIPPTIGFTAKLLIFKAALQNGYLLLVVFAMLNVVVSLYYYLKVLKAAYYTAPNTDMPGVAEPVSVKLISYLMIVLMILGGVLPQKCLTLAGEMVGYLLHY